MRNSSLSRRLERIEAQAMGSVVDALPLTDEELQAVIDNPQNAIPSALLLGLSKERANELRRMGQNNIGAMVNCMSDAELTTYIRASTAV
jgi:hypothetical protein